MASAAVIPLFPLPLILLPGEAKPLHVFEERYKKLLGDCRIKAEQGHSAEFGILYVQASGMASIGTSVLVKQVLKEHADGRCDVLVEGLRRFRLRQLVCKDVYDKGEVEWLEETPEDWEEVLATQVFRLHRQLLKTTLDAELDDSFYSGASSLALRVAPSCGLDCAQKQKLLEMSSENARLAFLAHHLKPFLGSIQRVAEGCRLLKEFWAVHQFLNKGSSSGMSFASD